MAHDITFVTSKQVIELAKTRRWAWHFAGIVPPDPEPRFARERVGQHVVRVTPSLQYALDHKLRIPPELVKAMHAFQYGRLDQWEFAELWTAARLLIKYPWDEVRYAIDVRLAECVTQKTLGEKHAVYNELRRFGNDYPVLKTCLFLEMFPAVGEEHRAFLEGYKSAPFFCTYA